VRLEDREAGAAIATSLSKTYYLPTDGIVLKYKIPDCDTGGVKGGVSRLGGIVKSPHW